MEALAGLLGGTAAGGAAAGGAGSALGSIGAGATAAEAGSMAGAAGGAGAGSSMGSTLGTLTNAAQLGQSMKSPAKPMFQSGPLSEAPESSSTQGLSNFTRGLTTYDRLSRRGGETSLSDLLNELARKG